MAIRRRAVEGIDAFRIFRSSEGEQFEIFTSEVLGAGAQGTVYAGQSVRSGERVAVKVIPTWRLTLEDGGEEKLEAIQGEVALLRSLGSHPNIARMIAQVDVFREGSQSPYPHYKLTVMELVQGRELAEHIALAGPMQESVARHVFLQVFDGLAHMHKRGIIHRDLKPENVLVTGEVVNLESTVKLVDFGVAKSVGQGPLKTVVGTPSIMAPEVAMAKIRYVPGLGSPQERLHAVGASAAQRTTFQWGQTQMVQPNSHQAPQQQPSPAGTVVEMAPRRFSPKIDVWSAGVVLYTCLTGKLPFKDEMEIIESDYLRQPLRSCSEEAKDLLVGMLEKEPASRLEMIECLRHPWVACSQNDECTIHYDF